MRTFEVCCHGPDFESSLRLASHLPFSSSYRRSNRFLFSRRGDDYYCRGVAFLVVTRFPDQDQSHSQATHQQPLLLLLLYVLVVAVLVLSYLLEAGLQDFQRARMERPIRRNC